MRKRGPIAFCLFNKRLKELDMRIQQFHSEIEKHKDALNELKENQQFLLKLTPAEFVEERDRRVQEKKQRAFRQFIDKFRTDKSDDEIIFRDDIDEIHEGVKCEPLPASQP